MKSMQTPEEFISLIERNGRTILQSTGMAQEKAYVKHRKVYVEIGDSIYIDEIEYGIPHDIACDHVSFYYNAKGNMSKAMSLHGQNASSQMKLVFQVGAGRVRLEKE